MPHRESLRDIQACLRAAQKKFVTLVFEGRYNAMRWPTLIRQGTGASAPILVKHLFGKPDNFTQTISPTWGQ